MAQHRNTIARAIIAGLSIIALAGSVAAQPAADPSGAWEACLNAPARPCVLQAAAEAARAIPARNDDFDSRASILSRISDAKFAAGLSAEAAATIDEALLAIEDLRTRARTSRAGWHGTCAPTQWRGERTARSSPH
jgi:hypothetical protein